MRPAATILSALAALAALPAAAQTPPPAGQSPLDGPLVARYVAAQKVGACVVRTRPRVAVRFVLSGPGDRGDDASPAAEFRYAAEPCLAGEFRSVHLQPIEIRGAMAEALLKQRDATLLRQARATPPRTAERVAPTAATPTLALFDCAVAAMPAQAAAMLDAVPASGGEAAAFQSIGPALQACAPAGAAMHVKPSTVRWLVATSLYRLVANVAAS